MAITFAVEDPKGIIAIEGFDIQPGLPLNITVKEINIVESLTSPVAQIIAVLQSAIYDPPGKNFDVHKNKTMTFTLRGLQGQYAGLIFRGNLTTYRLDSRDMVQNNYSAVEEMTFHAIDDTVLEDAKCVVSKSWKCTKPSEIVDYVLSSCLQAQDKVVDSADPARDYIAENIHPFQVIAQQANVALDGDDPSFLHFMTINENTGKGVHHFQSLKYLASQSSVKTYKFAEATTAGYEDKSAAISFSFPCDYDYLSDLLNGVDENGQNQNSMSTVDQVWKQFFKKLSGSGDACDCGIGQYNHKVAQTNLSTAKDRNSCPLDVESHLLKRQARMGLLERDKIALRIVVPWNPQLHAGKVITFEWKNKEYPNVDVYGHGDYLILALAHNIRMGGFSTTTLECVSTTVGQGTV